MERCAVRGAPWLLAIASLGAMASVANARTVTGISKAEARSLPAAQVKRRVMHQLSGILSEERFSRKGRPRNRLTRMAFSTKARATGVPGLCQIDRLTLSFRPDRDGTGDATTPVSVDGFDTTHFYAFRRPPAEPFNMIVDGGEGRDDAPCRDATLSDDSFFMAPDDRAATDGYIVAHRAMDAIVAGNPPFALSCTLYPMEARRSCADVMGEVRSIPISDIAPCESDLPEHEQDLCYHIFIGDRSLRILASGYRFGPDMPPPLTVKRVVVESLIVMTHERVD